MQKYLITGNSDLLPKANKTPKGNAKIIPKKVSINVKESPPQTLVSTFSKPNPPWINTNPIIGKIKIKKNNINGLIFGFTKKALTTVKIKIINAKLTLQSSLSG